MTEKEVEQVGRLDVVLICGLPGSGKSHFAGRYLREFGFKRINRAEIRKHLYTMLNFGDPWKGEYFDEVSEHLVKHVERKIIEHLLVTGHKVLIDNTSVTRASRKAYLEMTSHARKKAGVVFIDTPVKVCMERNGKREEQVPANVISRLYAETEKPDSSEGFSLVFIHGNN